MKLSMLAGAALAVAATSFCAKASEEARGMPVFWQGLYAGAHLGWAWGQSSWSAEAAGERTSGAVDIYNGYNLSGGTGSYLMGLHAGYNIISGPGLLAGIQLDASFPNRVGNTAAMASRAAGAADLGIFQEWNGNVRGRIGAFAGGVLFYGTAGWAWTLNRFEREQIGASQIPSGSQPGDQARSRAFLSGWVAGAGAELPFTGNWTATLEYLYSESGRQSVTFEGGSQSVTADFHEHNLRLGLNYHFGPPSDETGKNADISPKSAASSRWALHGQSTYVLQYAAPFREPYRGPNSLIPRQARETWDATAYVGYKPWAGGEIWFNPELVQGFGLSNTLGLAGFSSGEAYKLGSEYPYARIPRFFLRQTWNLGGDTEDVEAAANQFAGKRTTDRLVLTLGKFSVSDIFDDNKFAHDPRADFLNWALIDTGSWDYAADAWGYTYGASLEYVKGDWTVGVGFFDLPKFPNSTELDTSFRQHQWQAEIEHRHKLWGQPGEISVTGFLTHARMGRFDEATRAAVLLASPADIASVRRVQNRTGIAANFEQNLTQDVGFFIRAGISDGRLEPFAFTDIDRSAAAGFSIGGRAWGRPDHTLGIAGVVNSITGVHQRFLDAGGLGILVGDGRLPKPGAERILETYYSFPVFDLRATFDYQLVDNPAYNTDRGPVSIVGTRLRAQF